MIGVSAKLLLKTYGEAFEKGIGLLKMGFNSLSLDFSASNDDIDYVVQGVRFVCEYGWMLLPAYDFELSQGLWVNKDDKRFQSQTTIRDIDFAKRNLNVFDAHNLHLKTVHSFASVKPLTFYWERAYSHLVDTVDKI